MGGNVKVVEQAYDAFGRGDIPGVVALLDGDVDWKSPRTLPHGGEFHGPAEVLGFFQGIGNTWDKLELDVELVGATGDDVVLGAVRADGVRKGGARASYGAAHVFEVRDGKIRRFREYVDIDAPLD